MNLLEVCSWASFKSVVTNYSYRRSKSHSSFWMSSLQVHWRNVQSCFCLMNSMPEASDIWAKHQFLLIAYWVLCLCSYIHQSVLVISLWRKGKRQPIQEPSNSSITPYSAIFAHTVCRQEETPQCCLIILPESGGIHLPLAKVVVPFSS